MGNAGPSANYERACPIGAQSRCPSGIAHTRRHTRRRTDTAHTFSRSSLGFRMSAGKGGRLKWVGVLRGMVRGGGLGFGTEAAVGHRGSDQQATNGPWLRMNSFSISKKSCTRWSFSRRRRHFDAGTTGKRLGEGGGWGWGWGDGRTGSPSKNHTRRLNTKKTIQQSKVGEIAGFNAQPSSPWQQGAPCNGWRKKKQARKKSDPEPCRVQQPLQNQLYLLAPSSPSWCLLASSSAPHAWALGSQSCNRRGQGPKRMSARPLGSKQCEGGICPRTPISR